MVVFLMIICVLLIAIVLLQSGKAEGASSIISGGLAIYLLIEKNVVENYSLVV